MFAREFNYHSGRSFHCVSKFSFRYKLASGDTATSAIKEIHLEMHTLGYIEISLAITVAENQAGELLKRQLLETFHRQSNGLRLLRDNSPHSLYVKSGDGRYKNCQPIILFLHAHGAIDFVSRDLLLSDLSFPILSDDVRSMLIGIADTSIAEAKKKAFEWDGYDCDNAIFDLAEHLKSIGEHQEAMELYQEVPAGHRQYKIAQSSMRDIVLLMLQAHRDHVIELTPLEIKKYEEDLLTLSLNAEDTRYATQLFFELSGLPMRTDYPEIKPDAETLVMLTREILKLTGRIAELESEKKSKPASVFKLFDKSKVGETSAPATQEGAPSPSQGDANKFTG